MECFCYKMSCRVGLINGENTFTFITVREGEIIVNKKIFQGIRLTEDQCKWMVKYLSCMVLISLMTFFVAVVMYHLVRMYPDDSINGSQFPERQGRYNEVLLTHRLVKFDVDAGISDEAEATQAWGNIDRFMMNVKTNCSSTMSTLHFLQCASLILGQHFSYRDARTVTFGYAHHYSDCDANAYLLIDAAHAAGKEVNIVYSPGHAFISFIAKHLGYTYYWETTANNNRGRQAFLIDSVYKKSLNGFDYLPQSSAMAEKLYPVMIFSVLSPSWRKWILNTTDSDIISTPYFNELSYITKPALTASDVTRLDGIIQSNISSAAERFILARYYIQHGNKIWGRVILSRIAPDDCKTECLSLMADASCLWRVAYIFSYLFGVFSIPVDLLFLYYYFLFVAALYILCFVGTGAYYYGKSRNHECKKGCAGS